MNKPTSHSPRDIAELITRAGQAKTKLGWTEYACKAFMGGVFISLGGLADLTILCGSPGLRESNPALATTLGGFLFPIGFVFIILTNMELATSNMFIMPFTTLQRRTTIWDLVKNWTVSYIGNIAGCLFVAGVLAWWSDTLSTDAEKSYAVTQAEARVNVQWSVNFCRGIGCNFLVAIAFFLSLGSVEFVSKIYSIWIPIWAFVILGYQHSIANYFMVPIGMFYGTDFGVGKFIYKSIVPVTLGNIVGGALVAGVVFWYLYGREDGVDVMTGQAVNVEKDVGPSSIESGSPTSATGGSGDRVYRGPCRGDEMV